MARENWMTWKSRAARLPPMMPLSAPIAGLLPVILSTRATCLLPMSVDSGAGSTNSFPYFNFSFPPGTSIAQPALPATSEPAFPLLSPINLETRRKRSMQSKNDRVDKVRVVEQTSSIYNIVWLCSARKKL